MKTKKTLQLMLIASCIFSLNAAVMARPHGGPGWGGPGPGWGGPPPRYHHHHSHWGRDVVGGALAIGLGLGVAGAIANSINTPAPTYAPVVPTYVPPNYIVPSTSVVAAPPAVVTAPAVIAAPAVVSPTVPVTIAPGVTSGKTMYWCEASKNFYPYVTECVSGWQVTAVP